MIMKFVDVGVIGVNFQCLSQIT